MTRRPESFIMYQKIKPLLIFIFYRDFIGNKLNDTTVLQIKNLPDLSKL